MNAAESTSSFHEMTLEGDKGHIQIYLKEGAERPRNVLLCVHGGPNGDHRGNSNIFLEISSYAADLNFAVIMFDMYGSGKSAGYQRDFSLKTQIDDYARVLSFARSRYTTIIPIGESMGSTIVSMFWQSDINHYLHLWPAFDLADTDLAPYLTPTWIMKATSAGYIADAGMEMSSDFLTQIIEADFTRSFELPVGSHLLIHGKSDAAVPFSQSLRAVREAKGSTVLYALPDGDHGLQRDNERVEVHAAIKHWLGRHA